MPSVEFLRRVAQEARPSSDEIAHDRAERPGRPARPDNAGAVATADLARAVAELDDAVLADAAAIHVSFTVGSRSEYADRFARPTWGGGATGVAIGLGYDLGWRSVEEIRADWTGHLPPEAVDALARAAQLRGQAAHDFLYENSDVAAIEIPWTAAEAVLRKRVSPLAALFLADLGVALNGRSPAEAAALLSLAIARGDALRDPGEAAAFAAVAQAADGGTLSEALRSYGALFQAEGLAALAKRRVAEAILIEAASGAFGVESTLESGGDDAPPDRATLAYEVGLALRAQEAGRVEGGHLEGIGGAGDYLEFVSVAQISWGFERLMSFGSAVLKRVERELRSTLCGADWRGRLEDAARGDTAAIAGPTGDAVIGALGVPGLRSLVTEVLTKILPLPTTLCATIADELVDRVFAPMVGDVSQATADYLCANWRIDETPEELQEADAAAYVGRADAPAPDPVADPTPPAAPPDVTVRDDAPDVAGAAAILAAALAQNPSLAQTPEVARLSGLLSPDAIALQSRSSEIHERMNQLLELVSDDAQPPLDTVDEMVAALHEALEDPAPVIDAKKAAALVKKLRGKRLFDPVSLLADRFVARDPSLLPAVGLDYAQALIDTKRLRAGIEVLEAMAAEIPEGDAKARSDASALIGRAYKQRYVNHVKSPREATIAPSSLRGALDQAILRYAAAVDDCLAADRRATIATLHWPQVNRIALLLLAERDGAQVSEKANPRQMARDLIVALEPTVQASKRDETGAAPEDEDRIWGLASLAEAYLAIGDHDAAARHYADYAGIAARKGWSFHLESSIRQLEEVWRVEAGVEGASAIVANLKEHLSRLKGVVTRLSAKERRNIASLETQQRPPDYEELFQEAWTPGGRATNFHLLRRIVARGVSVCAIQKMEGATGHTIGTGWLVHGPDLHDSWSSGDSYVITNAHVVWPAGPDEPKTDALRPEQARIVFESDAVDGQATPYTCVDVVFKSPVALCDVVVLKLNKKVSETAFPPLRLADRAPATQDRYAIIGHPGGAALSVAVKGELDQMNATLVDVGPRADAEQPVFMHYDTPTEKGNSGSPVFETDGWKVIGVHRAGFGRLEGRPRLAGKPGRNFANEGVWIGSVRAAIAAQERGRRGGGWFARRRR